jgi:hypothetical protein
MIFVLEILFALIFGLVFTLIIFSLGRRWRPVDFIIYFLILFLFIWGAGIWMRPIGPPLWGVFFLDFLFVGIIVSLFIIVFIPERRPRYFTRKETLEEVEKEARRRETGVPAVLTGMIIAALVLIIIFGYIVPRV